MVGIRVARGASIGVVMALEGVLRLGMIVGFGDEVGVAGAGTGVHAMSSMHSSAQKLIRKKFFILPLPFSLVTV